MTDRERRGKQRFTQDEMSEILETAARLDGLSGDPNEISLEELNQVASELGIRPETIEAVVANRAATARAEREEQARLAEEEREAREKKAKAWRAWRAHLASYIAVMGGLFLMSLVTTGTVFGWWIFPAIGWGMGLGVHTLITLFNAYDEDDLD